MTDDDLIAVMTGYDSALARIAKAIYDQRHAGEPQPAEPAHCEECFEGCAKRQPG